MTTDANKPQQADTVHPRWIGYYAAVTLILVLVAQIESAKELAVAFAWLIALTVLIGIIDPQQGNLFKRSLF